jgi:phenylpyruvate tautomerase PptA (4-oxalocrotonate tautomerase family)
LAKPTYSTPDEENHMPLVTITMREGRSPAEKRLIGDVIQAGLLKAGVPEADRFQEFIDAKPENLIADPSYPDLPEPRDGGLVLIRILLSAGRSAKVKREVLRTIVEGLEQRASVPRRNVFIVFVETTWENWSFAGGVQPHV